MRYYLTRFGALTAAGVLLAALPMCAKESPSDSSAVPTGDANEEGARAALAGTPLGQVVSRNTNGNARVIQGGLSDARPTLSVNAETAARVHLLRHAEPLGLNEMAVRGASVTATHPIGNGASIVQFDQRIDGIEVFRSRASVLVDATKNLVSLASNLTIAGSATKATKWAFRLSPEAAMANIYNEHFGQQLAAGAVQDTGSIRGGELRGLKVTSDGPQLFEVTSKRILYPEQYGLTPAYYTEFFARRAGSRENEAFGYAVSAKDGRVLYKRSLTQYEKYKYRVWAETDQGNIPKDGPYKDFSPHPAGAPRATPLEFDTTATRGMNLIEIDGFNKTKDPWLPLGKAETLGNNVDAYSDRTHKHAADDAGPAGGNGFDDGGVDLRANTTSDKTFDRFYDVTQDPGVSADQKKAAVTQIFYDVNWMHDYWYDSGFDEASGNAQALNYGRGGEEKDVLLAEAQDGADHGESNNANMSTPSDGTSPRMQMYVWSPLPSNRSITTTPPKTFTDWIGAAEWGKQLYDLTAQLAEASPADACTPVATLAGKIAIVNRGTCTFGMKAKVAQDAGAVGIIIINNAKGNTAPSLGSDSATSPSVTIPVLGLSLEDGTKLRAAPAAVSATLHRGLEVPQHDGTIDNTVVAHEWGHYLHHRLVDCGSKSCGGMSEGWADFNALFMVARESDFPLDNKIFPLSQYAGAANSQKSPYYGIRRAPYSTDMTRNPFTFKHIQGGAALPATELIQPGGDMDEVHNVGEIWANTLFEGYVNLQNAGRTAGRSFQETKRRMADYIVAGMKKAPVEPTFTEQRDAILSVVWAWDDGKRMDDFQALAKGFAKRGMGVGAVAPPMLADANEDRLQGVVESFTDNKGEIVVAEAKVLEVESGACDNDGVLDAGETGEVTIKLRNVGWVQLKDTTVKVSTNNTSITFGNGGETTLAALDPYKDTTVTFPITIAKNATFRGLQAVQVTLTSASAVKPSQNVTIQTAVNFDDAPKTSKVDDVESASPVWEMTHAPNKDLKAWSRRADGPNHVWHGNDTGTSGDESLVSPELNVGTDDFTISFKHRFVFEYGFDDANNPVFYDGAVMELSEDNGTTWKDVTDYGVDPKYVERVAPSGQPPANPLSGRAGWVARDSYPGYDTISLNFGKRLSGKTVKVRFRIGTDEGSGAGGWDIDNIAFAGITNTPFSTEGSNAGICKPPPGPDGGVNPPPPGSDAGLPPGTPARYTNSDDSCSVGAVGSTTRNLSGVGLFAGLMLLLRRRRNR